MESSFFCSQCGLCCRNIHLIDELKDFHNGDGICKYLNQNTNLCKIYENRPRICSVERSYELFSDVYSKNEYYRLNYEGCKALWEKEKRSL